MKIMENRKRFGMKAWPAKKKQYHNKYLFMVAPFG